MDAVLKIQSSEFTDELIEKIKALIRGKENSEITISISDQASNGTLREETREEYFERLEKGIKNLEKGDVITFSGDSFELFSKHLTEKE
ncbi:hypothetical protein SAMN05216327_107170 [Dyadobacter sp. SG02]|uniref:hypothetical protein n=1 Tax=Dyadobacter sp. SG02 TaxID=1855291 RepID=UPI0008B47BF3|nr:hypothetical protein [Dyadobacter sp. SG02]SEJ22098.1 hypothetical protein SAMN05216327_107170 [Dyadobacter sp. SG02]